MLGTFFDLEWSVLTGHDGFYFRIDQRISMTIHIKNSGAAGYRSRYLSHAKRALYHLSYSPSPLEMQSYLIQS